MKLCGASCSKTKNGKSRGYCSAPLGHGGRHTSSCCLSCGVICTDKNTSPYRLTGKGCLLCRSCATTRSQKQRGHDPRNVQRFGGRHEFPCGCIGILPKQRGESNLFAVSAGKAWMCRVSGILNAQKQAAKRGGYRPVNKGIPHSVIRTMMENKFCERCRKPLKWVFGLYKTPHLHHSHRTGAPLGFAHPLCNMRAVDDEIARLKRRLRKLESQRNNS